MSNKVSYLFIAQDKFSRIADRVAKVTDKARRATDSMRDAAARASLTIKNLGNKYDELGKKIATSGERLRSAGTKLSLFATVPIALLGRSMVNAARDAEETRSKFDTVFKDIADSANASADVLAKNFGLAGTQARQLLGDTGDLLTGFGFSQESAFDLAKQVNELAVDLASFTNFSGGAEGASAALTKALLGERESVKSLGISILEEDVKRQTQIQSAKGMRFASERQAKAFATLTIAQNQSKNAIGDYARTSEGLANTQRRLDARTKDLSEKFGRIMLPIVLKMTNALIRLVDWFDKLSPKTQKTILMIGAVVAVLGPLLLFVGLVSAALPAVIAGFSALAVVGGLVLTPFVAIPAVFAAAFAAGSMLSANFDDIAKSAEEMGGIVGRVVNFVMSIIKGVSTLIGETVAALVSFDFSQFSNIADMFSVGGKVLGVFGGDEGGESNQAIKPLGGAQASRTDVNVNLNAPAGAVESVKSKTTGKVSGMNVGVNMAGAL